MTYVLEDPAPGTACAEDSTVNCYVVIDTGSMADPGSIGRYAAGTATPRAEAEAGRAPNLRLSPGDQTISVFWTAPQDVGTPALDGYAVQWRRTGTSDWPDRLTLIDDDDSTDYELGGIEVDEQGVPVEGPNEDGIENGVEYEVRSPPSTSSPSLQPKTFACSPSSPPRTCPRPSRDRTPCWSARTRTSASRPPTATS